MQVYKYKNYAAYCKSQIITANKKKYNIWAHPVEIQYLSEYIKHAIPGLKQGICHGVRTGWEVNEFRKKLQADIIGTEISTVAKFDHVIEWDFHQIKSEWLGQIDFIYSNAFDHSYDPSYCLKQWLSCLTSNGMCIIQWSKRDETWFNAADCFAASLEEYKTLLAEHSHIKDILQFKGKKFRSKHWFILQKKENGKNPRSQ